MRTLKLTIEYDGTDLCGWQSQAGAKNQPTVQEALEAALSTVLSERVRITGAGRTDAGVHARGQVAHLRTENPLDLRKILRGVNTELRRDIAVREIREAPEHFDARRSALRRHYRYLVWNGPAPSPLRARFTTFVPVRLDAEAMAAAARLFEGKHDFAGFRSSACTADNTARTMNVCRLRRRGPLLVFDFVARAFLHSQVRIMVGTLLDVGRGKRHAEEISRLLAHPDRTQAGPTAPPQGLTLWSITYPPGM
jgi:tRNA pseudouridine38-40 synthase